MNPDRLFRAAVGTLWCLLLLLMLIAYGTQGGRWPIVPLH